MQFIIQKKSLILSIIFFVFFSFVFVFLYKDINNKKEAIQIAQEKWQTETTRRENIKFLIDSIESIKTERTLLDTHFVQSSDVVPFLDTIEGLAKNVGANAEVISVDVAKDSSSLVVQMSASGSFETIYKLILLLENSPYDLEFILVDIKNLNSSIKKIPQLTATFQIKLLSFVN